MTRNNQMIPGSSIPRRSPFNVDSVPLGISVSLKIWTSLLHFTGRKSNQVNLPASSSSNRPSFSSNLASLLWPPSSSLTSDVVPRAFRVCRRTNLPQPPPRRHMLPSFLPPPTPLFCRRRQFSLICRRRYFSPAIRYGVLQPRQS